MYEQRTGLIFLFQSRFFDTDIEGSQLRNAIVLSSFGLQISRVHLENEHFSVLSATVRRDVFLWQTSHQNVVFDDVHWETCSPSEGSSTSFAIT